MSFKDKTLEGVTDTKKAEAKELIGKCFDERIDSLFNGSNKILNTPKDCILILGMNPAGNKNTANEERNNNYFYLNYICDKPKGKIQARTNNTFFKPILDFANAITGNEAKWDWCNLEWNTIKQKLQADGFLDDEIKSVNKFYDKYNKYDKHENKHFTTVFTGDMYYVHMTSQSDFQETFLDKNKDTAIQKISDYCKEMLDMHIEKIVDTGFNLKLIYINNATLSHGVSRALYNGQDVTSGTYSYKTGTKSLELPIVFGGMLSGKRCLDDFSRLRLVEEINNKYSL